MINCRKASLIIPVVLLVLVLLFTIAGCSNSSATTNTAIPTTTTTTISKTTTTPVITTAVPATTTTVPTTTIVTPTASAILNISAAASLTDAIKAIDDLYMKQFPMVKITANFAGSGTLQQQIEQGAPADVFISAAQTQMDNLQKESILWDSTRQNLLLNKVVMVVPVDSSLGLTSFSDLALDKVKKIAIGDPKSVPAGTYAGQAFDELGITAKVQPKEVLGADVRTVLTYVETGNVDAGIVYSTDALTSSKVKVVASAPADINAKVVYPVAVIKASKNPEVAKHYLNFLSGSQAKAVFEKYGFSMANQ
jgi:molybdate transport system substrate-binding protein